MEKKSALHIIFLFATLVASAQNEGTLSFMNSLPQVTYNNPAFVSKYKISVGLPGSSIMAYYSNNSFSYNSLVSKVNDSTKVDLSKFVSSLKPKNYITQALQLDLLRFSYRINSRLTVTFNSTAKTYNRIMFQKDLVDLVAGGTAQYIGKSVSPSQQADGTVFIETAVGASFHVDKKLTLGTRLKWLKGMFDVYSQSATLKIAVDNNSYALTANAEANIHTSGIYSLTQSGYDFGKSYKGYLQNNGLAIDLGATYRLDKLTLGASLIDIGYINWRNDNYNYSLSPASASYTFQGVDLGKIINGNTNYLNAQGDSIQSKFKFKESASGSYRTPIPGKMYLSGMFEIKKNFTAGIVLFSEKFHDRISTGLTIGANKHFSKWFSATGSYTITNNSFNNLGLGMSLNLPGFQLYVVGDNLLRMALSGGDLTKYANSLQYFNARIGFNFIFGREDENKKQAANPKPFRRR